MKVTPSFFRSEPVRTLLDRAAKAAALPMSLHYHAYDGNELHIAGWGGCQVCARANKSSKGARACCESRARAAQLALRQKTTVTFVCHLGLTCVSIAALADTDYVITYGPYIPAELSQAIIYDIEQGLRAIEGEYGFDDSVPPVIDDVRTIPLGAVSASAEWLSDALQAAYLQQQEEQDLFSFPIEDTSDPLPLNAPTGKHTAFSEKEGGMWSSLTSLSLLCGHNSLVRESLANRLEELVAEKNASSESLQSFLVQEVSRLLERASRMGCKVETARDKFPEYVRNISNIGNPEMLLKRTMSLLRCVHVDDTGLVPAYLPLLVKETHKHFRKDFTLSQFAREQGVAASTVTRALEYRINATFSEYLGRVRIENAQKLLRNTRLSAAKIGPRVGIQDQSNFGKMFRRYTGMNPGAYREKYQRK